MAHLTRFRPFGPFPTLHRDLDRFFGDFFPALDESGETSSSVWAPRMDVSETEAVFRVELDLPGVNKDEVVVNYQDGQLTISGERRSEEKDEKENFVRLERNYGSFFRSLALPQNVQEDQIAATFKEGVLSIVIPKAEEKRTKRIKVD